jgi:predicted TIM-barrel fold metal-dependent hydrolase
MTEQKPIARPNDPLHGQMLDTDGHMYMTPEVLQEVTAEVGSGFVGEFLNRFTGSDEDRKMRARNREDVWGVKGISALGSFNLPERLEALDLMGIRSQIVFPNTFGAEYRINSEAARTVNRRYNDIALRWGRESGGRLRAACPINMGDVAWAYNELERVIKGGATGIALPCAEAPGGVSPSHEIWDGFWARIEEAGIPVYLHLGFGGLIAASDPDPMLPPRAWGNSKYLRNRPADRPGGEEATSPYFLLVAHMPAELYLMTMVMGKVFERFPRLTLGIFEFGTGWIGPLVERMDGWCDFMAKVGVKYDMKPGEYVRRNVRTAPFFHEDVAKQIERYGLEDIYCFMSDFPHLEGGRDPIVKYRRWIDRLERPGYDQRFFVDNARPLFPGLA